MQQYEAMIIIDPEVEEPRQEEIVARIRDIILGGGGSWESVDTWGRRKLAYEIAKKSEAFYWVIQFDCDPATLTEASRVLTITDEVLRHMPTLRRPVKAPVAAK